MKLKAGNFYHHKHGRMIAVLQEIETWKFGTCFVIEEADVSGHGTSIVEVDSAPVLKDGDWTEIGKEEWKKNFEYVACSWCGVYIKKGDKLVQTDEGDGHSECYAKFVASGAPIEKIDIPSFPTLQ
jgi:hypothetical protein